MPNDQFDPIAMIVIGALCFGIPILGALTCWGIATLYNLWKKRRS
jgi:hypothetical protein